MLLTGMQLGHFRLKDLIGRSANDVYRADDIRLPGREVAIKIAQSDLASFSTNGDLKQAVNQFKKEAQIVGGLRHPNILPLFEYGEEIQDATVFTYLVMPYIKDGTLERWVKQRTGSFRNMLPLQEVGAIIRVAADALQCAHNQGVIHRDVKPTNFLIDNKTSDLSNPHILLADFGIAKISGIDLTTRAIGTFAYMAPEQWEGHPTKAGDQYSLAIIAYQLLTGHLPFTGNTLELFRQHCQEDPLPPSRLKPTLSAAIDTVILRALAKNPAARYPTITQFAEALQAAILQPSPPLNVPLTIKASEAKTGLTTTVAIPGGQPLPVYIPPNAQDGQIIRLDGKGTLHNDGSRGAVIVTLTVISDKVRVLGTVATSPRKTKRVFLAGLALLFILGSTIPIYFIWNTHNQMVASLNASAISDTHATATSIAIRDATATAFAHAAATAGVIQTATAGQFTYHDPLNDANNTATQNAAWDGLDGSSSFCSFQQDGYHILASSSTTQPQPCLESNQQYQNVVITVDMVIKSNVASGGLLFHVQNDAKSSSYFFEVSPGNGQYKISLFDCDTCKQAIQDWTASPSILHGQSSNTLQVIVNNNDFKFYVNGIFLTEFPNTTVTSMYTTGVLGLACYDKNNAGEAVFSNLNVYSA
ncbi:MAG TPA: protein kinase [Ktedonobacteraceae bacterium]|nr:protein kinase [Ktedonobacteraceae bacterium]